MPTTWRLRKPLGEVLVEVGQITPAQLAEAMALQQDSKDRLGQVLVRMGVATGQAIGEAIAKQLGLEYVDLNDVLPEQQALLALPEFLVRRYKVIPLRVSNGKLKLGMVDPLDLPALDDVRHQIGQEVEPAVISHEGYLRVLPQYPALDERVQAMIQEIKMAPEEELGVEHLRKLVNEAPVVHLVNRIILQAIRQRASDIHIEPQGTRVRIRYRTDGTLYNVMAPPRHVQAALISRVKIMAEMDIAKRRVPQDGRMQLKVDSHEIDVRVSTMPTVFGEKVVMRILDRSTTLVDVERLGLLPDNRQRFETLITNPYGIILLTGPTGSGKTTTLYTILNQLNSTASNIMTIEDPVEYQLPGVNQVPVNLKAGLSFANGLRSFLRQDPDIIMVGEIRDEETARIAIHAALTGHLVLSTLHTNDAAGAVTRLIDMGIEPFLVASSLVGVIAQRLVRVLCEKCKQAHPRPASAVKRLGVVKGTNGGKVPVYRSVGCEFCGETGYRGRTGIFEIMLVDDAIKAMITERASATEMKKAAVQAGMRSLPQDGLEKILLGITSAEEVLDVVSVIAAARRPPVGRPPVEQPPVE